MTLIQKLLCTIIKGHAKAKGIIFHLVAHFVVDHYIKSVYDNATYIKSSGHGTIRLNII